MTHALAMGGECSRRGQAAEYFIQIVVGIWMTKQPHFSINERPQLSLQQLSNPTQTTALPAIRQILAVDELMLGTSVCANLRRRAGT